MSVDGVDIKALDSSINKDDKELFIPAYNSPAFAKAFAEEATAAAGANSVRLVQAGKEGLPLTHAAQGETYTIQMANFPPLATELTVQLIGSQDVAGVAKQTSAALGTVKTDKGAGSLQWPVKVDAGTYYIRAVDATGAIFGMSQAIDVVPQARRKLYGPLVEL
jgi:hypothetical protein